MQRKTGNTPKKKPGRVSLPATPPPGSPFFGLGGGEGAPARKTDIPNLTARVTLAQTRAARLTQGGLLTPKQAKAEDQAVQTLAKPAAPATRSRVTPPKPSAQRSVSDSAPLKLGAPPAAPLKAPPTRTPASVPLPDSSSRRRGAVPPLGLIKGSGPKSGGLGLPGFVKDAAGVIKRDVVANLSDPLSYVLPPGAAPALHAAGINVTGSATKALAKGSAPLAEKAYGLGARGVGKLPTKIEVVSPAGAATTVTPAEFKALEAKGYDLSPRLFKRFTEQALKNGYTKAELEGVSGGRRIDMAFTKPPNTALRIIGNTAGDLAQLGTLPAGVEGAIRETAAGHGGEVVQALGGGLVSQLPVIGNHPVADMATAHPFQFWSQFAGAGKTAGALGKLGKIGSAGQALRTVEGVSRGPVSRNAWDATGQLASDAAARRVPRLGARVKAQQIDDIVALQTNKHRAPWADTQRPYKKALDKVGEKRAAELQAYHMSGGKPEQLAAFYRAQGNKSTAAFFDKTAKSTKTLSPEDRAFLEAHAPIAAKTTQGNIDIGKFGPTAARFRAYSPLIRSSAHLGNPEAQRILALRDEYLKGFNTMPEEDLAALRGAIDHAVDDFADQHLATPESLVAKAKTEHAAERARIEASAPVAAPVAKRASVSRSVSTLTTKLEKEFPGLKLNLSEKGDHITLSRIELPKEARGQGTGSEIMARIHAYADAKGKTVALTPSGSFGGSVPRLKKFYKRHGYIPNTGRNKDFETRETMLRTPGEVAPTAAPSVAKVDLSPALTANDARLAERVQQAQAHRPGVEPAYVAYSQPRPLVSQPFKAGPGGPTGFKKPRGRQKAETGATFESGQFLIDPKAPLLESIRMQRAHLADVLHDEVVKAVGRPIKAGDEIRTGEVFVSETNLRGLRRTVNDLKDNPVSAPEFEELVSRQQGIFDRLKGAAVTSTESVPKGEKGYALPIASWKRILDHTRPPSRTAYDRFMQQYQRVMISYRPSTFVNNAIGSPMLSATFGAGPKSYAKAWASGPNRDPSLAASYVSGHGVAGGLAPNPRSKIGTGFDVARYQSQKAEDLSRRASYMSAVLPGHKKRAKELGYDNPDDYLRDVAKGAVDEDRLKAGLDKAAEALGDSLKPNGPFGRAAGRTILFHNWVAHMAKTILYTLPVKHPRRLNILNDLSNYGDEYRQEHGVWPDWYASYLPLFQLVKRVGPAKAAQVFTKAFNTQGFNSFATLNNFADPVSTNQSLGDIALGISNPVISTVGKSLFARPYDSKSPLRFAAGQALRQVPGVSVVRPQAGMASDSIPFFSEKHKVYSSGKKRNGKTIPLDWDLRPGARPEPGILGAAERYLFGGVYDVPAQGPVHSIDQRKHIGAVAKKARKG